MEACKVMSTVGVVRSSSGKTQDSSATQDQPVSPELPSTEPVASGISEVV